MDGSIVQLLSDNEKLFKRMKALESLVSEVYRAKEQGRIQSFNWVDWADRVREIILLDRQY